MLAEALATCQKKNVSQYSRIVQMEEWMVVLIFFQSVLTMVEPFDSSKRGSTYFEKAQDGHQRGFWVQFKTHWIPKTVLLTPDPLYVLRRVSIGDDCPCVSDVQAALFIARCVLSCTQYGQGVGSVKPFQQMFIAIEFS